MSKKTADAINKIVLLDFPSDLSVQIIDVIKAYQFKAEICPNCLGSGISRATDRLCTACNGEGTTPDV